MKEEKGRGKNTAKSDITGIVLLAAGVLLFLWLFWTPSQGVIGKYVTSAVLYLFGWISAVFAVVASLAGALIIARVVVPGAAKKLAGIFIIVCSAAAFMDLSKKITDILPAGFVGNIIAAFLNGLFGRTGAYVVDAAILIIGVMFAFEISLKMLLKALAWPFRETAVLALDAASFVKRRLAGKTVVKPKAAESVAEKVTGKAPELDALAEAEEEDDETGEPVKKRRAKSKKAAPRETGAQEYRLPGIDLLSKGSAAQKEQYDSEALEKAFESFGIKVKVADVVIGPGVVRYELSIEAGQKISGVQGLANDIAMRMKAPSVRVLAPIPGKAAVGIEVPRKNRSSINLRDIIDSDAYAASGAKLPIVLGKNVVGENVVADLGTMPHLLIGGATGSGKSVTIHNIILSLLYRFAPWDLKLLLVDAKMVELTVYNDIPHLLSRVQTNVSGAVGSLKWVVFEMERRLKTFSEAGVRDIAGFHATGAQLPYIVVIIDELAELMAVAQKDMELAITRLSQMSRACGIHLILSTQRPSVNVVTGVIKANLPSRISLKVISKIDSRTILDSQGGESLLGRGDMLYLQPGSSALERIQAPFVSRKEVQKVVRFIRSQNIEFEYLDLAREVKQRNLAASKITDDIFWDAAEFVVEQGRASTSLLQRRFHVGYGRAAGLMDTMYELGIIGEDMGPTKGREILLDPETLEKLKAEI